MKKRRAKKKTFAEKAYQGTSVDKERSQTKIQRMLEELGITDVRFTRVGDNHTVEFIVRLQRDEHPRKVRMDLLFNNAELDDDELRHGHRENVLFRQFYWHIRNKFIAIYAGLKEFEEEFLADLIIFADGKEQRLGDVIVPQYKHQLKSSKVAIMRLAVGQKIGGEDQ